MSTPTKAHIEHAFSVRETASFGGADHIVLEEALTLGRLRREAGDALCKRRARFKLLDAVDDDRGPSCKRCQELAERIAIEIRRPEAPAPEERRTWDDSPGSEDLTLADLFK